MHKVAYTQFSYFRRQKYEKYIVTLKQIIYLNYTKFIKFVWLLKSKNLKIYIYDKY